MFDSYHSVKVDMHLADVILAH